MQHPEFEAPSFTCPHCGAFSQMDWADLRADGMVTPFSQATCHVCDKKSLWRGPSDPIVASLSQQQPEEAAMIYPSTVAAPPPHPDMPESFRGDFEEARQIATQSPRGAAALLRLCIQKLCKELGQPGKNINDDIAALVKEGLPAKIQKALDVVRVVGNNAVHPGVMSQDDHAERAASLFNLVNLIVQQMITQPKEIETLFEALPAGQLRAIEKRDAT